MSSSSEASLNKISNYSSIDPRVLTEHSNFSNFKDCQPHFSNFKDCQPHFHSKRQLTEDFFQKENHMPNNNPRRELAFED